VSAHGKHADVAAGPLELQADTATAAVADCAEAEATPSDTKAAKTAHSYQWLLFQVIYGRINLRRDLYFGAAEEMHPVSGTQLKALLLLTA